MQSPRVASFALILCLSVFPIKAQYYDDLEDSSLEIGANNRIIQDAILSASATCGLNGPEEYCSLGFNNAHNCYICNDYDDNKRHPIDNVKVDMPGKWWQSPTPKPGNSYEKINITIDLKMVYQITNMMMFMGTSPRPASWILDASIDGIEYKPWVYFSENCNDYIELHKRLYDKIIDKTNEQMPSKTLNDDEVYCTTAYSRTSHSEYGEIIIPLADNRQSLLPNTQYTPISDKLINFLSARFIRIRLEKRQTFASDWGSYSSLSPKDNRYFYYSINRIKLNGICTCNGHAAYCKQVVEKDNPGIKYYGCECKDNTCGKNCEKCCPLFNQKLWQRNKPCEECQCNGKADECVYNATVANEQKSKDITGKWSGGGVCVKCRENTTGNNCQNCKNGFYRPIGVLAGEKNPCEPCKCDVALKPGSTGSCVSNEEQAIELRKTPGDCICKPGYSGPDCNECQLGYSKNPDTDVCDKCTCDVDGSVEGDYNCNNCNCKANVDVNSGCKECKPGFFNLRKDNPKGCQGCFCFEVSNECQPLDQKTRPQEFLGKELTGTVKSLSNWVLKVPHLEPTYPVEETTTSSGLNFLTFESNKVRPVLLAGLDQSNVYYWTARNTAYLGNQLTLYNKEIIAVVSINAQESHLRWEDYWNNEPDLILEGNHIRLGYTSTDIDLLRKDNRRVNVWVNEQRFRVLAEGNLDKWKITQTNMMSGGSFSTAGRQAKKEDLYSVLANISNVYVKARFLKDGQYGGE
ncbi:Laminin subunit alpha-1 [Cichlidogyrus casuarinus]|uniref:Laminin subunit alpha-1 n=1 Tax=Cichlidogyrus casuarinus TaxID=1844966 RepID=A0ABD2QE60_9PLAT